MKNIISEKPSDPLHGRALYNTLFVAEEDIRDKDVLDIGCGFGWFELNTLERGAKSIIGIEPSAADLQTAEKNLNNSKVSFRPGSAIDLPFTSSSFDTAVSWEVLEHIPQGKEQKMLEEVMRVLKPGGVFYISTPHDALLAKIFDPAWILIKHRHYKKKTLERIANKVGFNVEKVEIRGGFYEVTGMLNLYFCKWLLRRRPLCESWFASKQDREYRHESGFTTIFLKLRKESS